MIKEAIKTAVEGVSLPFETAREAMDEIMRGEATPAQIAAFLTALRMKGESIDEITACATVMREKCTRLPFDREVMDIVGTGGDEAHTFNISTVTSFVVATAGVPVAKHGNRSVSSKCGAADFLEALGAKITLTAEESARVLAETDMCFMFAPNYHASMKYAAPVRKEIGARTIFNILGPLSNPAFASMMLLGVYDKSLVEPLARVLSNLGVRRAMVVNGDDGLDEISLTTTTTVCEVDGGALARYSLDPRTFGLALAARADLVGGDPAENAAIARRILGGETGPKRDVVLLNAASCLYLAGRAPSIMVGVAQAAALIDSGAAQKKMEQFIRATNEVAAHDPR
ncbi:anthranilate phosphoribosyltransferase [Sporobacter termitidis DSM 10068]|uniref:Anthranilate phosphoribosyltransferase n=1 Tax=Sporobacter termitidis DSM 10068 TaxID=1123282 RepID=A0A1M5ZB83_9FIRM|nr:anthranilate phosphoribosyltransferase [Sporobacter termitidis]SHI21459.1 anthranilate phosphoribosyltransferase [Sporobacter termitidis DSM 10068]